MSLLSLVRAFKSLSFKGILFCLILSLCSIQARAFQYPLRDPAGLINPKVEDYLGLEKPKVILADYEAIKEDFEELRFSNNDEIDEWLIKHSALIAKSQTGQSTVNSLIHTNGVVIQGYRPAEYGRAAVFRAGSGLLEVKGIGAVDPLLVDHKTGLATLGEVIREFAYEKLVRRILAHAGAPVTTVRCYAVIDPGFDVMQRKSSPDPAGLLVRQAHERFYGPHPGHAGTASVFDGKTAWSIESILRRYGVTSAGANRNGKYLPDQMNIQGTKDKIRIVDFGAYLSLNRFEKPVTNVYSNAAYAFPDKPGFIQPDPLIRVPMKEWGSSVTGIVDPKTDNPSTWSHELAKNLRAGIAQRKDAEQHLRNLLGPVEEILRHRPSAACIEQWVTTGLESR